MSGDSSQYSGTAIRPTSSGRRPSPRVFCAHVRLDLTSSAVQQKCTYTSLLTDPHPPRACIRTYHVPAAHQDKYGFTALMNAAYYDKAKAAHALCRMAGTTERTYGCTAVRAGHNTDASDHRRTFVLSVYYDTMVACTMNVIAGLLLICTPPTIVLPPPNVVAPPLP